MRINQEQLQPYKWIYGISPKMTQWLHEVYGKGLYPLG